MEKEKEKAYLKEAQRMASEDVDFKRFHNHFFSQGSALLQKMNKTERFAFTKSSLYKDIFSIETKLGLGQGYLVLDKESGVPVEKNYSGEFRLRLAKTLHRRLVVEAREEKVSLNNLCLLKLARPLQAA